MPWVIEKLNDAHTNDFIIAFIYFEALKLGKQFKSIEFVFIVIHGKKLSVFCERTSKYPVDVRSSARW